MRSRRGVRPLAPGQRTVQRTVRGPPLALWCALCAALPGSLPARAAGGHHAIDDAAMLGPGQCQAETWVDQGAGSMHRLLHAGPACRVGPVELGLNVDHTRDAGAAATTSLAPQVKWAATLGGAWSAGVSLTVSAQRRAPHYIGSAVVVPLTWEASETTRVHLNAGRDFLRGAPDSSRGGLALEWAPREAWSFVVERFRENNAKHWRAGARWIVSPAFNIDVSRATAGGNGPPAWWTLGLTWAFDR